MRRNFGVCLVVVLSLTFLSRVSFAMVVDDTDCPPLSESYDLNYIDGCGCQITSSSCNITQGPINTIDEGTPDVVAGTSGNCHACQPGCGTENPPTTGASCDIAVSVTITESVDFSVTAGVGASWIPGIKASLEGEVGGSDGQEVTESATVHVDVDACEWAKVRIDLDVTKGTKVSQQIGRYSSAIVGNKPGESCSLLGVNPLNVNQTTVTATTTANLVSDGNFDAGVVDSGNCPLP